MSNKSLKSPRRKRKLEPITIEELLETSNMAGFVSFLDLKPGERIALPHLAAPSGAAGKAGTASETGAPETSAPDSGAPTSGALETGAPESGPPPTSTATVALPSSGTPDAVFQPPPSYSRRTPRIREALTAQDGHSLGEQAIYETMFRLAAPYNGEEIKILTIGYRTLAEKARMAYSNCKANVRSLTEKLAIEPVREFSGARGTTFLVYGYREILQRRRAAGLTHVRRDRGIVFVDPVTGKPITPRASERRKGESGAPETGAPETGAGAPETGAPETGALSLYKNIILDKKTTTSSSSSEAAAFSAPIVEALHHAKVVTDDEAVRRLIEACREKAPDATAEEIARFVSLKASQILASREVRNPMGLLQVAVPKCFEGESFRLYREAEQRRRQAEEAQQAESRAAWEAILNDPDAEEDLRSLARQALGL